MESRRAFSTYSSIHLPLLCPLSRRVLSLSTDRHIRLFAQRTSKAWEFMFHWRKTLNNSWKMENYNCSSPSYQSRQLWGMILFLELSCETEPKLPLVGLYLSDSFPLLVPLPHSPDGFLERLLNTYTWIFFSGSACREPKLRQMEIQPK